MFQVLSGGYPLAVEIRARAAPAPILRIGFLQTIDSLNPYIGLNDASYLLYGLIYDYPFAFDQDGNYIPNLITSASCAVADCSVWNYAVRTGVYWSDGSMMTPGDVAFTWNYDSQNLFHLWAYEPYFNQVVQCTGGNKGHCGAVLSGGNNVTVYFNRPFVSGEDLFGPIVQQAQWSGVSPQTAETTYQNQNPIGTGPFIADPNIYTEWQQNGAVPLHLFRNTRYHPVGTHVGMVNITDIYLYVYNDPTSLALAIEHGDIQLASLTTAGYRAVKGLPNILTQAGLQAIQEWDEIGISQIDTKQADGHLNPVRFDTRVRNALARATNKDYILQTIYKGQGVRGDTQVSPVTPQWWYDPVAGGDNLTFDLTFANQILDNAGYTAHYTGADGGTYRAAASNIQVSYQTACSYPCPNPTTLTNTTLTIPAGTHMNFTLAVRPPDEFPEESLVAQYLQAEWKQVGVEIQIRSETSENALSNDVYGGAVEMYIWYWSADPDPNYILSMESSFTLDGWNDNYWNNATYNQLYLKQLGDENLATRQADVKAAQKLFYETGVYIIYIFPYGQWGMRTDLWQGWGDWVAHPYRQINAYWGANPLFFDLNCPSCSTKPPPSPPTAPVLTPSGPVSTFAGTNVTFTATSTDANTTVQLNFTFNWGDGNATTRLVSSATPTASYGHVWATPGIYNVSAQVYDGYNPPVPGTNKVQVTVVAPTNVGYLVGTVTGGGAPIGGAEVKATPGNWSSSTSGTGAYNISLPAGTYSVTADAALFLPQTFSSVAVTAGVATTQNFVLTPNVGWIVGTVKNNQTNNPIAGATIVATSSGGIAKSVATDSNGHFNVSVEPGTYTVNASATGFKAVKGLSATVSVGQETSMTIGLDPLPTEVTPLSPLVIGAIALVIIVVAAAVIAVFIMRRRGKKEKEEAKVELPPKQ